MNRILIFALIFSFASCSLNKKNDLESMNLKGNVRSVVEKTFTDKDTLIKKEEIEFNRSGQIISDKHIIQDPAISMKYENRYNLFGRLIEQKFFENDSLILKQIYLKNRGKKDSIQIFDPFDNLLGIGVINYNKNNKETESVLYDETGKVIRYEASEYNIKGNLTKGTINKLDSAVSKTTNIYIYDSLNRVYAFSCIVNGKESQKEEYHYKSDKIGNWIEKTVINKNGKKIKVVKREIKYK